MISAPPLPMTIPGFAHQILTFRRGAPDWLSTVRSISILGTPAPYSCFFSCLRILWSSTRVSPNSFLEVNQRLSQSLMTPTRMPWGLTFWPIVFTSLLFLFQHNSNMAGALQDTECTALCAGTNALQGGAGSDEALGHIQAVLVHIMIVFRH
ncbi:hypothetical protein EVA_08408 [gut metagenome]|uniref:Uncharacterized protein n=1 Tax=gut metagenome TaxID=749906 RepID=J9G8B0_9ZZZZ